MSSAGKPIVLVVEDEFLVADTLREMLVGLGCDVLGPFGTLNTALAAAAASHFDAAILDVRLHREDVFPVAEMLHDRKIPFALATGYDVHDLPARWDACPKLQKPFRSADFRTIVTKLLCRP